MPSAARARTFERPRTRRSTCAIAGTSPEGRLVVSGRKGTSARTDALETLVREARRILLIRLSSIGDVIKTIPFAHALRELAPRAEIRWLVQTEPRPLIETLPPLDGVFEFDRRGWYRSLAATLRQVRAFGADLAIDLQGNAKSGLMMLATRAPHRIGLHGADYRERLGAFAANRHLPRFHSEHAGSRVLEAARALGWQGEGPRFDLGLSAAAIDRAASDLRTLGLRLDRRVLCLNVGRTDDVRSWPIAHQRELLRAAPAAGWQCLVQGGPAESEARSALLEGGRLEVADALGRWSLRELAAIYRALCDQWQAVVAGPDSGPLHLAAASGLRVIGLYGPQAPTRTGPLGDRHVVLGPADLPCAPCFQRRCRHQVWRQCMAMITPRAVLEQLTH